MDDYTFLTSKGQKNLVLGGGKGEKMKYHKNIVILEDDWGINYIDIGNFVELLLDRKCWDQVVGMNFSFCK